MAWLVCWLRCTLRCVPLIVCLRRRQRWQYTAGFACDDAHHVSVQTCCRHWHSTPCPCLDKDVDMPVVVLDSCPVLTCRKTVPQLQFVDQVEPSLFGNRDMCAQLRAVGEAAHGTQVANSRWQRLARGTMCEDPWKVPVSVPCVGYDEIKDSLVVLHGDVTTIL